VSKAVAHKKTFDEKLCKLCKSPKHVQKECAGFKEWLKNKGNQFDPNYKRGGVKSKSG
jgi:hypothetical protein